MNFIIVAGSNELAMVSPIRQLGRDGSELNLGPLDFIMEVDNSRQRFPITPLPMRHFLHFSILRDISLFRSNHQLSYSSLLIPISIMGQSCMFHKKWREQVEHDILLPNILWDPEPIHIPMTHCPNPRFRNQEQVQFYSRSRPCRGLDAHLLSHSWPGGCPDHCVTRSAGFWQRVRDSYLWLFFVLLIWGIYGVLTRWNLFGTSLEYLWNIFGSNLTYLGYWIIY